MCAGDNATTQTGQKHRRDTVIIKFHSQTHTSPKKSRFIPRPALNHLSIEFSVCFCCCAYDLYKPYRVPQQQQHHHHHSQCARDCDSIAYVFISDRSMHPHRCSANLHTSDANFARDARHLKHTLTHTHFSHTY